MSDFIMSTSQVFQQGHIESSCYNVIDSLQFIVVNAKYLEGVSSISHIRRRINFIFADMYLYQDIKSIKIIRWEMPNVISV